MCVSLFQWQHSLEQRAHSTGQQRTYSTGQQRTYNTGQQQAHSTGQQRTYSTGQQHSYSTGQQVPAQVQYSQAPMPHPESHPEEQPSAFAQQLQQRKQQLQQQQQQQQLPHPQTGEYHAADTAKRGGVGLGAPSGLAAEIAARAASRKPMVSSPTKKEFDDPRFNRSATISSMDNSMAEARCVHACNPTGGHTVTMDSCLLPLPDKLFCCVVETVSLKDHLSPLSERPAMILPRYPGVHMVAPQLSNLSHLQQKGSRDLCIVSPHSPYLQIATGNVPAGGYPSHHKTT